MCKPRSVGIDVWGLIICLLLYTTAVAIFTQIQAETFLLMVFIGTSALITTVLLLMFYFFSIPIVKSTNSTLKEGRYCEWMILLASYNTYHIRMLQYYTFSLEKMTNSTMKCFFLQWSFFVERNFHGEKKSKKEDFILTFSDKHRLQKKFKGI